MSILDLQPFADVTNNLIDKLFTAAGWLATREGLKDQALSTYVDEIKNSDDPPLVKAAKISAAKKTIKEYMNQVNIVDVALQNISDSSRINDVDNDWLALFMDMARIISDEEFQLIWGKILAEECNEPGCIPKGALCILQRMDKDDAYTLVKIASLTVNICGEDTPYIVDSVFRDATSDTNIYKTVDLSFDDLTQLEALGIIKIDLGSYKDAYEVSIDEKYRNRIEIKYFDEKMIIEADITEVPAGSALYTKDGRGLYKALQPQKVERFWKQIVVPILEKRIKDKENAAV